MSKRSSVGRVPRTCAAVVCAALLMLWLPGCASDGDGNGGNDPGETGRGVPVAGMAQGYPDFPVGTPLGGYTARCRCLGNSARPDGRRGAYHDSFHPSVGVQTHPKVVALWLENGLQEVVFFKTDAIYTFEGIVTAVEQQLSDATGRDMAGKVVIASNHSHSAPANFDQGVTWYLGGDKFNREVFERTVASMADIALAAFEARRPAALGVGQITDWDPNDRVYSDRRGDNNQRVFFDDIPAGPYKDPYLTVLRVDTADGTPMGMLFAFGMHGTVAGEDNQLWSVESAGHVETVVEERFDTPMIVGFMQHGGGDASPRGVDQLFARMESIGEFAADAIVDLWERIPTSAEPIRLETVTRSLDTSRDAIRVQREYGALTYTPYTPGATPDDVLYDELGRVITPIDEFNASMGAAFCGSESLGLPVSAGIGSNVIPYSTCIDVSALSDVIGLVFGLPSVPLPLPESLYAKVTASRMGPLPILNPDGVVETDDVLWAFFPGEPTATYTEQFRRRARTQLNMTHTIPVGYAQDHQGYLLIPEDWLLGGYEPNINVWGPLQGEHIMEGVLTAASDVLLTEEVEPYDPIHPDPVYTEAPLPALAPDLTPEAGTALSAVPPNFHMPVRGLTPVVSPPAQVRRIQDIVQFMWEGGDPGVDLPEVELQMRRDGGVWEPVRTAGGHPVTSALHDLLLSTTPDPLGPARAAQRHYWWVAWQAVAHVRGRAGLPLGTYRFLVRGRSYAGGATTWPWPSTAYELASPSFEVVPAEIRLTLSGDTLRGAIDAPVAGFRLVDIQGNSRGANPVHGATLTAIFDDGSRQSIVPTDERVSGGQTAWTLDPAALTDAVAIEVLDPYGNRGTVETSVD